MGKQGNLLTWDYLISKSVADLRKQQEIDIDVEGIMAGWKFLECFYGDEGLEWLARHDVLGQTLINGAPWARIYIGSIGNILKHVSEREDFHHVGIRLSKPDQFASALFEAEIAYQLDQKGVANRYLDTSSVPSADIEATIGGKRIRIEVHRQTSTRAPFVGPFEIFGFEFRAKLDLRGIEYAGVINSHFSKNHWRELLEKLKEAIDQSRNENRLVEVVEEWIPGPKAVFAVAPSSLKDDLIAWKTKYNLDSQTTLLLPGIETDFGRRVNRTIAHKLRQIPEDLPGVLVIEGVNFMFTFDSDSYKPRALQESWDTLSRIEEFVYDQPKLAYVVLRGGHMGPAFPERVYDFDPIWISTKERCHMLYVDTVVIGNRFSKHGPIPEIVDTFL